MKLTGALAREVAHIRRCQPPPLLECQHVEDGLLARSPVSPGCGPPNV